jgi:flagellar hook-associated protein 3 FlgL
MLQRQPLTVAAIFGVVSEATQIGNLESVNTYEVSTRITDLQTQIEDSYALTSQLAQLSLVKFL